MNKEETYITEKMLLELPQDLSYLKWFVLWFLFENKISLSLKRCITYIEYEKTVNQLIELYNNNTVEIIEICDLHKDLFNKFILNKITSVFYPDIADKLNRVLFVIDNTVNNLTICLDFFSEISYPLNYDNYKLIQQYRVKLKRSFICNCDYDTYYIHMPINKNNFSFQYFSPIIEVTCKRCRISFTAQMFGPVKKLSL